MVVGVGTVNVLRVNTTSSFYGSSLTTDNVIGPTTNIAVNDIICNDVLATTLIVSSDLDVVSTLGKTRIGVAGMTDDMVLSHIDRATATGYALMQEADGTTHVNSYIAGAGLKFQINSIDRMTIDPTYGDVYVVNDLYVGGIDVIDAINLKQDTLIAGTNIDITGSTISVTGGGSVSVSAPLLKVANNISIDVDAVPTDASIKMVNSGALFTEFATKQDTLTTTSDIIGDSLQIAPDVNTNHVIGKCVIGSNGHGDLAVFSHYDYTTALTYGVGINTQGTLELNGHSSGKTINLRINGGIRGYVNATASNMINFTGQHRCFVKDVLFSDSSKVGLIVCADQNRHVNMNKGVATGNKGIDINEALPVVSIASKVNDKSCFGVISGGEDPDERVDRVGNFNSVYDKESGDTRFFINSVGEGGLWICDVNGAVESGDYITTCLAKGYGALQADDILHNYTVAKVTMNCDFNPALQFKQIIKKVDNVNVLDANGEFQWEDSTEQEYAYDIRHVDAVGNIITESDYTANGGHKCAFVGVTYHCG